MICGLGKLLPSVVEDPHVGLVEGDGGSHGEGRQVVGLCLLELTALAVNVAQVEEELWPVGEDCAMDASYLNWVQFFYSFKFQCRILCTGFRDPRLMH